MEVFRFLTSDLKAPVTILNNSYLVNGLHEPNMNYSSSSCDLCAASSCLK